MYNIIYTYMYLYVCMCIYIYIYIYMPSILCAIPSPRTSAHQTANGTMYPVFRMRPRTAKGNFVIARARAKLTEKGLVVTALPE